jgi:hypothetical protein
MRGGGTGGARSIDFSKMHCVETSQMWGENGCHATGNGPGNTAPALNQSQPCPRHLRAIMPITHSVFLPVVGRTDLAQHEPAAFLPAQQDFATAGWQQDLRT